MTQNTLRTLVVAAVLTLAASSPAMAGEIPIGPAPCDQTTQQCAAPTPVNNTTANDTEMEDVSAQGGAEEAAHDLAAVCLDLLLSLLS